MIKGIGTDIIEIERFSEWHNRSIEQLQRVFTLEEIEYSLHEPRMSAARFATRFATKEAAYKALSCAIGQQLTPFSRLAPFISIIQKPNTPPKMIIEWGQLPPINFCPIIHVSLSHSDSIACAFVVIEAL